ncbi:MAG: hypothetical protein JWO82_1040 [Akkermansiaceae bacterium]|nr:hypothetical protein [Akkermansiaceae bacterium]
MSSPSPRNPSEAGEPIHDDHSFESEIGASRRKERVKRLLQELISRWHWIALGLILGVLGSLYYLSKAPSLYTAQARILVKQKASTLINSKQDEDFDLKTTEALNTVSQQIRRFELLQRVAARPDVRALPGLIPAQVQWLPEWAAKMVPKKKEKAPELEKDGVVSADILAAAIENWLEVSLVRNSRHIDVKVTHPSNQVAMVIANDIAEEYQNEVLGSRADVQSSAMGILVSESEQARQKLQIATSALASYTRALTLHQTLEDKENEVRQLSRRYLPKHPKMLASQGELDTLKQRFLEEFETVRHSRADQDFWETSGQEIDATGTDQEARLRTARQLLLARSGVLKSEIDSQNSVFNSMLTRLQEVDVNKQSTENEAKIDSRARLEETPTSPKRSLILAAGGVGGLMLGLGVAMMLIRLDNTFHTVAQLEAETGAPVLASISAIQPRRLADAENKARKKGAPKPEGVMAGWNENLVFRPGLSSTPYAEMYRVLRASVSLLGDESHRRITLFTSALPGEGKSLTSANFALAAAAQGRRTLLIDLDLRKPNVHRVFGLKRTTHDGGVTECLAGLMDFDDVIQKDSGSPNLHLILAGKRAPNPGELLHPKNLKDLLDRALAAYDTVILDTAPLLAVPDTRILAPLAHHLCLVTRADFVPKRAVFRALETLQDDGTSISGLVFNGFTEKRRLVGENYSYGYYRRGYGYGRGYGSYGTYGDDDEDDDVEMLPPTGSGPAAPPRQQPTSVK